MFLNKFFLVLIEIFIAINILIKYEVKSEISALDKCIEEESERLLLKRKKLSVNLYSLIDVDIVDVDGITKNLAKSICYFVLPSIENIQNEEDVEKRMTDDPNGYENHNTRRTLEESNNKKGTNEVLREEEMPTGIPEPEINNNGRIKFIINDISNGELSNPLIEEEKHEKSCDEESKITKFEIRKILASFMKKLPLKVLVQQKLKEENLKQQKEEIIPWFMYH